MEYLPPASCCVDKYSEKLKRPEKQRQMTVKHLLEAFFEWAKEVGAARLPKGKTLEGINYCINQKEALKAFLNDGVVPLDNNATEGALRCFCLYKLYGS